ncbi:unnamed protein product [Ceutorhynchus assimilis]|uniref:FAD/NAD(P)-binding domain-containing protein n=1 Tax=Ceutorhynchus assimilis TaxID=467358 RepID=A0A9P0GM08_9CUCU|nr:unnamed protein product [Ceutorhynchus assimilis]
MNTNSRGEVNANANEDSQVSISSSKSKSCKAIPELLPKCDAKCLVPLCEFDYDLLVIGAGVAGLAAAIEANEHGARVAIVNCVEATPLGTRWSIGGTCINVGSIPKKLFHVAALLGEHLTESEFYGWNVPQKKVNWTKLKNGVQKHIKDTNLAIKLELFERKIDYYYAKASFKDPHTVETIRKGRTKLLKGKIILIAVGSRSEYPHIPGVYLGISIDDLFSLDKAPGKTLIIGDGYISAEIAGILNGLGYETCILCMKPEPFTELDSNMAFKIMNELRSRGVKFYIGSNVDQIEQSTNDNTLTVVWYKHTERYEDEFDTVLFSMGRTPYTADLGLQKAGVELAADGKKIFAVNEQTNVPHIYAIGDVLYGKPELSSVANKAGQLLARKLFAGITITDQINYDLIPVTVLTPVEYSYVGKCFGICRPIV